ncbi:hypothetical protein L9F63_016611, partial [Diploptera punctata]
GKEYLGNFMQKSRKQNTNNFKTLNNLYLSLYAMVYKIRTFTLLSRHVNALKPIDSISKHTLSKVSLKLEQ